MEAIARLFGGVLPTDNLSEMFGEGVLWCIACGIIVSILTFIKWIAKSASPTTTEKGRFPELPKGAGAIDIDAAKTFIESTSGLKYRVLRKGEETKPKETSQVIVNYHGWLDGGHVFDSSYKRGKSVSFGLNQVIAGWTEGIQYVGVGGMIELEIPSKLGYGPSGTRGIPGGSTLHFLVELIEAAALRESSGQIKEALAGETSPAADDTAVAIQKLEKAVSTKTDSVPQGNGPWVFALLCGLVFGGIIGFVVGANFGGVGSQNNRIATSRKAVDPSLPVEQRAPGIAAQNTPAQPQLPIIDGQNTAEGKRLLRSLNGITVLVQFQGNCPFLGESDATATNRIRAIIEKSGLTVAETVTGSEIGVFYLIVEFNPERTEAHFTPSLYQRSVHTDGTMQAVLTWAEPTSREFIPPLGAARTSAVRDRLHAPIDKATRTLLAAVKAAK